MSGGVAALLPEDDRVGHRDLRRVVPTARFDGLRVRVEMSPSTAPLAVHDPATRTLHLPATTAAGVLAHELAHDLDWQAARACMPGVSDTAPTMRCVRDTIALPRACRG